MPICSEIEAAEPDNLVILASQLLVRQLPHIVRYVALPVDNPSAGVIALEFEIAAESDVLVKPRQRVEKGQVLAANSAKVRRISLLEAELESRRRLRIEESSRVQGELVVLEQKAVHVRSRIAELERIAEGYKRYSDAEIDFSYEVRETEEALGDGEFELAAVLQRADELRSQDAAGQIRYEQEVARLAAEIAELRGEAYLKAPVGGRVGSVLRIGRSNAIVVLEPASHLSGTT